MLLVEVGGDVEGAMGSGRRGGMGWMRLGPFGCGVDDQC